METTTRDNKVTYSKICQITGKPYTVIITYEQYYILNSANRPNIQDILPDHSAEEREFLLSGNTPDEWNALFEMED